jgi:hypothetical protein
MLMIDADTFVDGLRADLAYRLARMRGIDLARDMARHGSDAARPDRNRRRQKRPRPPSSPRPLSVTDTARPRD